MEFLKEVFSLYGERKEWFIQLILEHIGLSMTAICLAGIIGLLLGIWISEHEWAAAPILGIANIFYTIPAISLLGMLIPLFGIGNTTAVIALTLYGIMPMVRNTYAGMKGVSSEIISAAEGMGSTKLQLMMKIKLPLTGCDYCRDSQYGCYDYFSCSDCIVYWSRRAWSCHLSRDYDV